MVWPGGDQGYGKSGQGPSQQGGWPGYPPPGGPSGPGGSSGPGGYGGYGGPGGGYGGPPGYPPPPRRSSGALVVVVIVVVTMLVGGGVATALVASKGHKKHPAPVAASTSPPLSGPPSAVPSSPPPAQAKVPGWHAVVAVKHGLTYDVPPSGWAVQSPDTIVGFEDSNGQPEVGGSGASIYKPGYCQGHSGSWRAQAVVTGYSTTDLGADAKDAAQKWGTYAYTADGGSAPSVSVSGPQQVTSGGTPGQEATANVTVHDSNPCSPPRGVVHAVAIPLKAGGAAVLVVMADQGVSDGAPDSDLQKIAGSARPTA